MLAVGWGTHTVLLVYLVFDGPPEVATLLVGTGWLAMIFYYFVLNKLKGHVIHFVFPPFAMALLITAYFSAGKNLISEEGTTIMVLYSRHMLGAHIVSIIAGILLFGMACLASIVYLHQERQLKAKIKSLVASRMPALSTLEKYNHKAITLGFFFLTLGILLGLIVSGPATTGQSYVSLRQIIPIGMWLTYALFLLVHDVQGRRGRFGAYWSITGFVVVVFSLAYEIYTLTIRL